MKSVVFCLLLLILGVCPFSTVFSDTAAITKDGKKVLLKEKPKEEGLYDFRKTTWGMSKTQVKKTEKGEAIEGGESPLLYHGRVAGLDCIVAYSFVEEKLVRTAYMFTEDHSNRNDHISDYNNVKEILVKKYGEPIKDETIWKNDLYRDDAQRHGFAVSLGHLVLFSSWATHSTQIGLLLRGENYEINFAVQYQSKKLKVLEEKAREKKSLKEF